MPGTPFLDECGKFDFGRIGNAEAGAPCGGGLNLGDDAGMRVSEDRGSPGQDVIDEFVAVDIADVAAPCGLDEERLSPDAAKGADG